MCEIGVHVVYQIWHEPPPPPWGLKVCNGCDGCRKFGQRVRVPRVFSHFVTCCPPYPACGPEILLSNSPDGDTRIISESYRTETAQRMPPAHHRQTTFKHKPRLHVIDAMWGFCHTRRTHSVADTNIFQQQQQRHCNIVLNCSFRGPSEETTTRLHMPAPGQTAKHFLNFCATHLIAHEIRDFENIE